MNAEKQADTDPFDSEVRDSLKPINPGKTAVYVDCVLRSNRRYAHSERAA